MHKAIIRSVALVGIVCAWSSRASASTINFLGEGKVGVVEIHSPGLGNQWVYAGELDWAFNGDPFYSYCVDVNNWGLWTQIVDVKSSAELTEPGVINAGGEAAWLVNTYAPGIHVNGSGDDAAALQVAIWTVLFAPGLNPAGEFSLIAASDAIRDRAHDYLMALYAGGPHSSTATWFDAAPGAGQDQMIPVPTPEPTSLLLLTTGLAWTATRRRRSSAS
jgi:hypothetical protein